MIKLETKIRKKTIRGEQYSICDTALKVDERYFNSSVAQDESNKIKKSIRNDYWAMFGRLYLKEHVAVVRLGGLHFDIQDMCKYKIRGDRRTHMILHYHSWPVKIGGIYDEESFALLVCDKELFRELWMKFWFSLGCEIRFVGFIVRPESAMKNIEKWKKGKISSLIGISSLVIDNLQSGFHFRLTGKREFSSSLDEIRGTILK